jgi:hypothetical protein
MVRMSNLSSINCYDTHGNGRNDPVVFTGQTQTSRQRVGTTTNYRIYQNYELSQVFYNPYPEILYNFPISSNYLNNRYFDFTFTMQFTGGDFIDLTTDQEYFDLFHISLLYMI